MDFFKLAIACLLARAYVVPADHYCELFYELL
jgi:hypothetical protein